MKNDNFKLNDEEKQFADTYDKQSSVFCQVKVSTDTVFSDVANKARAEYEALQKAKQDYLAILNNLSAPCKNQFQEWVTEQTEQQKTSTKSHVKVF